MSSEQSNRGGENQDSKRQSTYDKNQQEAEKNQKKYEDGLKKGYIDKAAWERIDNEYKKKGR